MIEHTVTKADVKHDLQVLESWLARDCTGECESCKYRSWEEPKEFWMEPKEFCRLGRSIDGLRDRLKRMR